MQWGVPNKNGKIKLEEEGIFFFLKYARLNLVYGMV